MADLSIINAAAAASYAGVTTGDFPSIWVQLANGLVSDAWKNPSTPVPAWVQGIALEAVARAIRNPKGLSSWTRSIDDGSRTERLPDTAARAGVFLTDDEYAQLQGGSSLDSGGAFTIRPQGSPCRPRDACW